MNKRLENELEHGRKLASEGAEDIWNWDSPAGKVRAERRATFFVSTGKIKANDKVLELGCGTGLFTRKVHAATGASIVATDLSEELLQEARKKFPEGDFRIADAMNLDFPDNSFDVVFGSSIIHHLDMEKSLQEIFRVLNKGGRMVFAEPNMINPQILVQKNVPFIKRWLGDSPDESAIVRWNFSNKMQQHGFINVSIFPYDFLHPAIPAALIKPVNALGKAIEKIPLLKEIAGSVIIFGEKP